MSGLKIDAGGVAVLVGAGLLVYLLTRASTLTTTATNAAGEKVTAYEGRGPLGTLGAAANAASGGYLASLGQWLGGAAFDLLNPTPADPVRQAAPTLTTGDFSRADRLAEAWDAQASTGAAAFGIYPRP